MYKPLSDSTLMNMTKKEIIEHLRIAEHNHRVCEETIDQQYRNCMELLKNERAKVIDECISELTDYVNYNGTVDTVGVSIAVTLLNKLKEKKYDGN